MAVSIGYTIIVVILVGRICRMDDTVARERDQLSSLDLDIVLCASEFYLWLRRWQPWCIGKVMHTTKQKLEDNMKAA